MLGHKLGLTFRRIPASFSDELGRNFVLELVNEAVHLPGYDPGYLESLSSEDQQAAVTFTAMGVTTNMESALRYLRDPKQPRTLWIDALCINQTDEVEKRM
ncbi:hypothetical protein V8F33_013056 [Rhypophila sp. PSN 637]